MTADRCEQWRELIGLAALGRLDSLQQAALERHLAGCPECQGDMAELRAVGRALSNVDSAALAEALEPPGTLENRVVRRLRSTRRSERRARWLSRGIPALAGAACAAAITVGVFLALDSSPPAVPATPVMFTQVAEGIGVEGELIAHTWGVEVDLVATGLANGQRYDAWLVRRDGTQVTAGSFVGVSGRPIVCKLNGAVLLEDARAFVVTSPDGRVVMEAPLSSA